MHGPPVFLSPQLEVSHDTGSAKRHLFPLDGIRGLAILMVVCSHLFRGNTADSGLSIRVLGKVLDHGAWGVDLFFVLSGFLITGILVDTRNDRNFLKNFYARRTLRIFPLYYGVLALLAVLTPFLHLDWGHMGWLLVFYLQNLDVAALMRFSPRSHIELTHFWSLAVEEQFYLLWPAVVLAIGARRRLLQVTVWVSVLALLLRMVLVTIGTDWLQVHVSVVTRADALLLGGALALLYRSARWPLVLRWAPAVFASCFLSAVVGSVWCGHHGGRMLAYWLGLEATLLALSACGLIAWALRPGGLVGQVFELRWITFFGKYSYGIYVWHLVALGYLLEFFRPLLFELTHSKALALAGAGLLSFALSVGVAWLSFQYFEKPFTRLKRYFEPDLVVATGLEASEVVTGSRALEPLSKPALGFRQLAK